MTVDLFNEIVALARELYIHKNLDPIEAFRQAKEFINYGREQAEKVKKELEDEHH